MLLESGFCYCTVRVKIGVSWNTRRFFCLAPQFLRVSAIMASCGVDPILAFLPALERCTWKWDCCQRMQRRQPISAWALTCHVREMNFCLRTEGWILARANQLAEIGWLVAQSGSLVLSIHFLLSLQTSIQVGYSGSLIVSSIFVLLLPFWWTRPQIPSLTMPFGTALRRRASERMSNANEALSRGTL